MKIVHVIAGLTRLGGAETTLARLIDHDSDDQHVIVSLKRFDHESHIFSAYGFECSSAQIDSLGDVLGGIRRLRRIIRAENPDAVQSWMYHADLVTGLSLLGMGVPVLAWGVHHSNLDPQLNKRTTLQTAKLCSWFSRVLPDKIVYCAQSSAGVHEAFGYVPEKRKVIPNGYDLDIYRRSEAKGQSLRRLWNVADSEVIVGCVGRWHPQKDHANLIAAISIFQSSSGPPTRYIFVGPMMDSSNSMLRDLIQQFDVASSILLVGMSDDMPSVMSAFDLLVLPSRGEAFPNVVGEAMSCEVPALVTDVGDAAKIVGNTGWVVPPRNSESLAASLLEAVSECSFDHKAFNIRKFSARQRVKENFGIVDTVKKYREVWRRS